MPEPQLLHIWLDAFGAIAIPALLCWIASIPLRDASIVDRAWSLLFVAAAAVYAVALGPARPRVVLTGALLLAWALRLALHITLRNWGHGEDRRYQQIRRNHEPGFAWKSLYIVFGLQAVLAWIISLPLLGSMAGDRPPGWRDVPGVALWLSGFVFEWVGDSQLTRFRASKRRDDAVLDTGLWRYSRHPNYFGECCQWWGFYLLAVSAGAWWTIVAPVLMTVLLLRVSGVALLERDIGARRPAYREYIERTNAFIPRAAKGSPMKIAVIGAGITGNVVARGLYRRHDVSVFEAGNHVGGHSHTHQVEVGGTTLSVDTGFIVYNDATYPRFSALLAELGVATQETAMSFSVRNEMSGMEYASASINTLFAQRMNLLRPRFHRMWAEILRFNRHAATFHDAHAHHEWTLGDYVREQRYSDRFVGDYLVPMASAIWSAAPADIGAMPARFLIGFFRNHGMLTVNDRPQWRTVSGGSAQYVAQLVAPFRSRIHLRTPVLGVRRAPGGVVLRIKGGETLRFDRAFFACHSDQALALLEDATPLEREVLGAMPYQENEVVLHTDARLMPRQRRAWAAWNYHVTAAPTTRVCVTYNMNILQSLPTREAVCVTLNRADAIDPRCVLRRLSYQHPVFSRAAVAAQARLPEINGADRTYFCGAYARYGFHEDGVVSAETTLAKFSDEEMLGQRAIHRLA